MAIKYSEQTLKILGGPPLYPLHPITLIFLIMQAYPNLAAASDAIGLNRNEKNLVMENKGISVSREDVIEILDIIVRIYTGPTSNKKALLSIEKDWFFDPLSSPEDLQAAQSQSLLVQGIVVKKFRWWVEDMNSYDLPDKSSAGNIFIECPDIFCDQPNLESMTLAEAAKIINAYNKANLNEK